MKVQKCFAAWNADNDERRLSASGGIGFLLAKYVVEELGGVFYGTRYDSELHARVTRTDNPSDLPAYKGSKYVHSSFGKETYHSIKNDLEAGRKVLFIGTPCQVAGLRAFLKGDESGLIAVDLLCHGTSPSEYLDEEISFIKKKKGIGDITNIRFRGNDGHNFHLSLWNGETCLYDRKSNVQPYFYGYLQGISLREVCYSCRYANPDRTGDITIGDFLSLGKAVPFDYPVKNVSVVTANSDKGTGILEDLASWSKDLVLVERRFEERLLYKPAVASPTEKSKLRDRFLRNLEKHGFASGIRRTVWPQMVVNSVKNSYSRLHHLAHIVKTKVSKG